jgi:hypothetical protein
LEVTSPFGNSPDIESIRREKENSSGKVVTVGVTPCPMSRVKSAEDVTETEFDTDTVGGETRRFGNVYARRKQNEGELPTVPLVPSSSSSRSTPTLEASTSSNTYSETPGDIIPFSDPPMTLRRTSGSNAGRNPDRYGIPNTLYNIAQFASYSNILPVH